MTPLTPMTEEVEPYALTIMPEYLVERARRDAR